MSSTGFHFYNFCELDSTENRSEDFKFRVCNVTAVSSMSTAAVSTHGRLAQNHERSRENDFTFCERLVGNLYPVKK